MKIHVTLNDGTSKTVDIDVSKLSEEQLNVYAEMGAKEAIKELKKRIGFNPFKPIEEYTEKDMKDYEKFLESQSSNEEENNER